MDGRAARLKEGADVAFYFSGYDTPLRGKLIGWPGGPTGVWKLQAADGRLCYIDNFDYMAVYPDPPDTEAP